MVVNLSKHSQPAEIDLKNFKGYVPVEAFSKNRFPIIKDGLPYFFTLSQHSFQWFILQKTQNESVAQSLPTLELKTWNDLTSNSSLQILEREILPVYLQNKKWFKGKTRTIYNIAIIKSLPVSFSQCQASLLLIEVCYESGLADIYQLVVTFLTNQPAKKMADNYPDAVIVNMAIGLEEGMLCDAF